MLQATWLSTGLNGQPGVLTLVRGELFAATTIDVADDHIRAVHTVRNAEKLRHVLEVVGTII